MLLIPVFQFYNSAIKRFDWIDVFATIIGFQFYNSAIKRMEPIYTEKTIVNFNSTIVRLKGRKSA